VLSPLSAARAPQVPNLTGAAFSPTFAQDNRLWLYNTRSIIQSVDGGSTWSEPNWPLQGASLLGFAASGNADGPTLLFAFMHDPTREPAARYFRSTDLGQTWQEITEAFRDPNTLQLPNLTFETTSGSGVVFALSEAGPTWMSTDAGATWTEAFQFPPGVATPNGCLIFNLGGSIGSACAPSTQIVPGTPAPTTITRIVSVGSFLQDGRVLVEGGGALWTYKVR
jgi:photosystem II stability/assembly factor-like uncharacterized protein